ncbi:protein-disulfide reductase DsbD domain-containing protein, partial [Oleiphilus sp. HI0086]
MRNILLVIIYLTLGTFTSDAYSSGGTSFSSSDSKGLFESSQNEFLKVDEAFKFRSSPTDNGLKLSWEIADGYYLYKERFKFRLVDKSLEPLVKLGPPEFSSQGKPKQDDYFGLVHAFYKHVEIALPI